MPTKEKPAGTSKKRRFSKAFVQAAIDAAPEHVEEGDIASFTDEQWKTAIRSNSYEELTHKLAERRRKRGERGPQKAPTKVLLSLRLSPEVVEHFRATGEGWQTRIDKVLRRYVARRR